VTTTDTLAKLDQRLMNLATEIEKAGNNDTADEIRVHLAYLREAWDGSESDGYLPDAVEAIQSAASGLLGIVLAHSGQPELTSEG
jgi:hypothetical protein